VKPRLLGLLAGLASLGFGWWLLDQPHTSRELFLCMVAWVLGFWVAAGIRGSGHASDEDWEDDLEDD
jgi:hypothetical protein